MDDVKVLGCELKEFYDNLTEIQKELFFILVAAGKTGIFTMNYITCTILKDENMF